ncbi:hypothetical protein ADIMK_3201 [Marinobacterium lacunae]|uniref:Uncharacterized protein n=1 Tax=Marinobacterium lacunae TaxID=1232683 RepID=A0A081FW24_9GAMM|nr:hypothetical protein ADIMK_3201 [Marinobacterium lacunae]
MSISTDLDQHLRQSRFDLPLHWGARLDLSAVKVINFGSSCVDCLKQKESCYEPD